MQQAGELYSKVSTKDSAFASAATAEASKLLRSQARTHSHANTHTHTRAHTRETVPDTHSWS